MLKKIIQFVLKLVENFFWFAQMNSWQMYKVSFNAHFEILIAKDKNEPTFLSLCVFSLCGIFMVLNIDFLYKGNKLAF